MRKGKAPRKPKIKFQTDEEGKIVLPAKVRGWTKANVELYSQWLYKAAEKLEKEMGTAGGQRFLDEMQREVDNYVNTHWGIHMSIARARLKKKKALIRKRRRQMLMWEKLEDWQALEDKKEERVFRDRVREERESRHERFSFKNFLREKRDQKRAPPVVLSDEEFEQKLEEDRQNYLIYPPKSVRRVYNKRNWIGYEKRVEREIVDPWLLEIRRRARMAELVQEREEAIAELQWREKASVQKEALLLEREAVYLKKMAHWNEVYGQWHRENNYLRLLKAKHVEEREKIQSKARLEFLKALQDDVNLWTETPTECRFLRFRFAPGVNFPYNKSHYM